LNYTRFEFVCQASNKRTNVYRKVCLRNTLVPVVKIISSLYTPRARAGGGHASYPHFGLGSPGQQHEESPMASGNYQCGVGPSPGYRRFAQQG
jgi:hypothetical protein